MPPCALTIREGMEQAELVLKDVAYCNNAYETMEGADALVLVTEWGCVPRA